MPYKILLIDDSITQLEMLKRQFVDSDFIVETATNGVDGYRMVFEMAPDVILSDIIMPDLNGYQLCRLLKNNPITSKIPVILLTVLDKKIDKFWGNKSGANKFVSKTTENSEIQQIVNDTIEQNKVPDDYKQEIINNAASEDMIRTRINEVFDDMLMDSTFLSEFRNLSEFLGHEKVLVEKTFELLGSFIDYNILGLFFKNPDKNEKNILYLDVNKNPVSSFVLEKIKREFFAQMPELSKFTVKDFNHSVIRETIENNEIVLNSEEFNTVHTVPFFSDGKLIGGICFYNKTQYDYTNFKFYNTLTSEISLLFKMRYLYSETEYLSITDGLTGLYNRRHFEHSVEREFLRVKRYPADLSLAMIDIDHFKEVNDTYGHQFGDYVLREISDIIVNSFRKTDMVYRYGGEELVVILPEIALQDALNPIERLRNKIAQTRFLYNNQEANITISVGVSSVSEPMQHHSALVGSADKALYKAKQSGRNKVVAYANEQFENVLQQ